MRYFNSIKVRLKLLTTATTEQAPTFQFHKGTIKTFLSEGACSSPQSFQFHKGTIKTLLLLMS